jgi:eukaryotic-like serine/threonine-protein kinase
MGVVYLAEETEPLRREVALKTLKPGLDTRQIIARFAAERQSLAVMEHPSIARVFDAGETEAGRPYFVMERVDGAPITRYCDDHRLTVAARVKLLMEVAAAVQHAHQKGVIHRDLKPSNVLVGTDTDGAAKCKIIDFGIARAVQRDEHSTRLTAVEHFVGTPAYMSPEQALASGLDIDTRTDIYSLGVLAYEVLAGALPFDDEVYRGWGFLAQHIDRPVPRPSDRLAQLADRAGVAAARQMALDSLRRELRGDLDWIVIKAMSPERDRRYETANGLATDLGRYVSGEPVVARPPSRGYRMRKFVRRHRVGVIAAGIGILLLSGFGAAMAVQANLIELARQDSERRRVQADDLIDFMLGDLRTKLTEVGRLDILDAAGARALRYFAATPMESLDDAELARRVEAVSQLGQVRIEQGDLAAAAEAFRESLELSAGLAQRQPDNAEWQVALGAAHFWVGYVHWLRDELDAAESEFMAYLDISQRLAAREPDNLEYALELGYAWSNIGSLREARGDLAGAMDAFRETLAAKQALVRHDPANQEWQLDLAHTHNSLGVVLRRFGRLAEAETEHRAEVGIKEALVAADERNVHRQRYFAIGLADLAGVIGLRGDSSSLRYLERAVAITKLLHEHDPDNMEFARAHAMALRRFGEQLLNFNQPHEAMARLRVGLLLMDRLVEADPESPEWRRARAELRLRLASALLASGQPGSAVAMSEAALSDGAELNTSSVVSDVLLAADAEITLGRAAQALHDSERAREHWRSAATRLEKDELVEAFEALPLRVSASLYLGRIAEARVGYSRLQAAGYGVPGLLALARANGLSQ